MAPSRTRMRSSRSRPMGRQLRLPRGRLAVAVVALTGCRLSFAAAPAGGDQVRPDAMDEEWRNGFRDPVRSLSPGGVGSSVSGGFEDPRRRGWLFSSSRPQYATNRRGFPSASPVASPYPLVAWNSARIKGPGVHRGDRGSAIPAVRATRRRRERTSGQVGVTGDNESFFCMIVSTGCVFSCHGSRSPFMTAGDVRRAREPLSREKRGWEPHRGPWRALGTSRDPVPGDRQGSFRLAGRRK